MDLAWWVYQFGIINSFGEFIFLRCRTNYFLSRRARSPHSLLVGNSVGDFHAGASSTESVVYCVGTAERSLIQGLDPNVRGWKIGFCGKTFTTASLSQKNSKNFLARNDFLKLFTPKFFQWKPNGDSSLKRRLSSWCHCFGISLFYSIQRSRQPRAGPPIFLRISNCKRKHHLTSQLSASSWDSQRDISSLSAPCDGQHRLAEIFGQTLLGLLEVSVQEREKLSLSTKFFNFQFRKFFVWFWGENCVF